MSPRASYVLKFQPPLAGGLHFHERLAGELIDTRGLHAVQPNARMFEALFGLELSQLGRYLVDPSLSETN